MIIESTGTGRMERLLRKTTGRELVNELLCGPLALFCNCCVSLQQKDPLWISDIGSLKISEPGGGVNLANILPST